MSYREAKPEEISANPFQMIGSQWMLVTAEKEGKVNTMTASWGGVGVLWGKKVAFVFLRPQRYTKTFVDAGDRFTLSFYGEEQRKTLTYLGRVSGRDEDKIKESGLTVKDFGGAPAFEEAELVFTCKKLYAQELDPACFMQGTDCDEKWYPNKDYHTMYVAEIEQVFEKE